MQALLISTSYPSHSSDWKGQFIKHLLFSLAENEELSLRFWAPPGETPSNVRYCASNREQTWLKQLLDKGGIACILRNHPISGLFTAARLLKWLHKASSRNPDVQIVHVNWLQNSLPFWNTSTPLVVSVLGSDFALLKKPGMVRLLRAVFKQRKVVLCPNAKWMEKDLGNYFGDLAEIHYVPFGIEQRWFNIKPMIQPDAPRKWLVVLRLTEKKIGPLFDWGKNIFNQQDQLHLFGPMQEEIAIPEWVYYHGATHPEELEQNWFPNASGLISLSQHSEGRPQILMEAMAAGIPVIASGISAHKDLITHNETGLIVDSEQAFKSAIELVKNENSRTALSDKAKQLVKNEMGTWEDCAKRYFDIYRSISGGL
jgi:glycosyltransferase involved in cell wall biosynthesis